MHYSIIQPPFTLKFREMTKQELKDYYRWFLDILPDRIAILADAIRQTPGFEAWDSNESPESLNALGEWFLSQVETRPRTSGEIEQIQSRSSYSIEVSGRELTNRTFSIAIDIGMYISRVFLNNFRDLRWGQEFGNKHGVNYGQPVLVGFPATPFNPVNTMVTLAYAFSDGSRSGTRLREIYDYWSDRVT